MSHRKCVEIRILLEKFHILGAVGIESEDGAETSWGVREGGWGAIGEIQPLPPKGHAKTHIFNNKHLKQKVHNNFDKSKQCLVSKLEYETTPCQQGKAVYSTSSGRKDLSSISK